MISRRPIDKKQKGFTFIELLVVITIVGILFAAGVVAYGAITVRSRDTRRKADLEAMRQSLEMCRSLTGHYPWKTHVYQLVDGSFEGSVIKCSASGPTLMNKTPLEPKFCDDSGGGAYSYELAGDRLSYTLESVCMELEENQDYVLTNP